MTLGRRYFRTEGVVVKHPDIGTKIAVERIPGFILTGKPVIPGGFEPIRLVIDLNVVDAAKPATKINRFIPPIEVKVRFTEADLAVAAARGKPLCLGYWDGIAWIRCTPPFVRSFRMIYKPEGIYAGWGIVTYDSWGDPGKAWGT